MLFNSFEFLWLFPLLFATYWLVNRPVVRAKVPQLPNLLLIGISYGLYIKWNPAFSLLLLGVTAVTYCTGLALERVSQSKKSVLAACGIVLALLPLTVFKYADFILAQANELGALFGMEFGLPGLNWALPLGISFFTFQAVGYVADVYLGRIKAERNWWDYMLFVCFFPQIAAGPIGRANSLLPQIKSPRLFNPSQCSQGMRWLLWGMFLKVVMADRIGLVVDPILAQYQSQSSALCAMAAVLYSLQIYGDFAGYSFMALGVGQLMGFELTNNFKRPYLSQSITEFWHRWHISLSTWLRDYVYIPLGGSRCSKARSYLNIAITFLVSGIWHGANWTFIVWGILHGLFQIAEKAVGLGKKQSRGIIKVLRVATTFVIVTLLWVIFRMPTFSDAYGFIGHLFSGFATSTITITPSMKVLLMLSTSIVVLKNLMDEFLPQDKTLLHNRYRLVRFGTYIGLTVLIVLCGVFDASQFIYARF